MTANSKIKKAGLIPHLYLDEVTGYYLARVYHAGTTRSRSLKTKNLSLAKQKLSGAIKEIITADRRKHSNKLVRDYYKDFHHGLEGEELSVSTMTRYSVSWRHHVEPFWGDMAEHEITQDTYSNYLKWFREERGGKIFNHLKLLRGLFSSMRKAGAKIDAVEVYLPKKEADSNKESKGTYIERAEMEKLLSPEISPRLRLMVSLAYTFGFRIGELANLKRERVKVIGDQVQVHLKSEDTKTRAARIVPLTSELGRMLHFVSTNGQGVFVFTASRNNKRPVSKQVIDREWLKALRAAGIRRRIRFHDLRHTAATNLADIGVDPVKACAILGMTLKIYMGTYVKQKSLNLSGVIELMEKPRGDA